MIEDSLYYFGPIIKTSAAMQLFQTLNDEINWQHDEIIMFGKKIITKRKVAWHANRDFAYTYSKTTHRAKAWTPALLEIKQLVEEKTGLAFNSCLLNYYENGEVGMGWHSDNEKSLAIPNHIASVSLGAERRLDFRDWSKKRIKRLWLENGSLLWMKHPHQEEYQHALAISKKVKKPRINLTFRNIKEEYGDV